MSIIVLNKMLSRQVTIYLIYSNCIIIVYRVLINYILRDVLCSGLFYFEKTKKELNLYY